MSQAFPIVVGFLGIVVTQVVVFLLGRRAKSGRIDTSEAKQIWNEANSIRTELRAEVASLRCENQELRKENAALRKEVEAVCRHLDAQEGGSWRPAT